MKNKILSTFVVLVGIVILYGSTVPLLMGDGIKATQWWPERILAVVGITIAIFLIIVFTKEMFRRDN